MKYIKLTNLAQVVMASAILSACSGDSEVTPPPPVITAPPEINAAQSIPGPLATLGRSSVSRFIKNGIYSATISGANLREDAAIVPLAASNDFSTTNTQEAGVDEADRIEYDGNYMYVATFPNWQQENPSPNVRILKRNDDFTLEEVNNIAFEEENIHVTGLYLNQNALGVIASTTQIIPLNSLSIEPWNSFEGRVEVKIYDTSVPSEATSTLEASIDGHLLSSRRIGNQLYLALSYVPFVEELTLNATTDEEKLANYRLIVNTPNEDIMPKIHIDGTSTPLNNIEECAIPQQATANDGFAQLVTLVRVNMDNPSDRSASCLSVVSDLLYMSSSNMYLTSGYETDTQIHKISLDNELTYQASGAVPGIIGWRSPGNLRLSEHENVLRIVTSDYSEDDPEHTLFTLSQQGSDLVQLASLPNDANPEPLGKEGEDIFAVRFIGDRGYIVTFEQIDPLYVIDLSDASAPQVLGSLEIPGFSSYLHPISDNLLLGVGQNVAFEDIPQTGDAPTQRPVTTGMKVSLFNIQDPANPQEVSSISKESAYTPVEWDYKALSSVQIGNKFHFAMPVEHWAADNQNLVDIWAPQNSLLSFEVDPATNSINIVNELTAPNQEEFYIWAGEDRSVLHAEHIYYLRGNQVWHGLWQNESELRGPY